MSKSDVIENEIENIVSRSSDEEIYYGLLEFTKNMAQQRGKIEGKKKLYYISAEFLIGKLLSNNLINLGLYDQVAKALEKHGKSMAQIEEIEPEPSLGNGGLGRLASCFLDSIATLGLNGDGVGINYHLPITVLSDVLETIPYEVLTSVSTRVKRIYYQD